MEPIQRRTARVIPVSPLGQVLLLRGHDPEAPDKSYWFTIGGRIEPGENARQAAMREMREEVGIVACEHNLRGPFHEGEHAYSFGGVGYHAISVFFTVALQEDSVQPIGLPGEIITGARWSSPSDVWHAPVSNQHIPHIVALTASTPRT